MDNLLNYCQNNISEQEKAVIYSPKGYYLYFDTSVKDKIFFDEYNQEYKKFYNLLWDAYLEGDHSYWFNERQYTPNNEYSGLNIDIDAYREKNNYTFNALNANNLIKKLSKILCSNLNLDEGFEFNIYILMNPAPYEVDGLFKEGIHIVIPYIKLRKEVKAHIINNFKKEADKFFVELGYKDGAVDTYCIYNPVQIYGTIRDGKKNSHKLKYVFKITVSKKPVIQLLELEKFLYVKKSPNVKPYSMVNLALELSLHYNGINKKIEIEACENAIPEIQKNFITFTKIAESDEKIINQDVNVLIQSDFRALEVKKYIDILDKKRGVKGNTKEWAYTVEVILNINIKYGCLAKYFSINADAECWNKNGLEGYTKIYEKIYRNLTTILDTSNHNMKYMNILKSFARSDSPEAFEKIRNDTLETHIIGLFNKKVVITDTLIADLVKNILGDRYKYVEQNCAGFQSNGFWYEYIINPEESKLKPFIYKWYKHTTFPKSIDSVISKELTKVLNDSRVKVITAASQAGTEKKSMYKFIIDEMERTIKKCGNDSGILAIKKRCQASSFYSSDFDFNLDDNDNILGVGNGILEFKGTEVKFINKINNFKITKTTDTLYIPYDPNDKYIKKVEAIIADIIIDEKKREGMLIHMSRVLIRFGTMRVFTIWQSGGGSGKSVLMNLMCNALGQVGGKYGPNFGYYNTINPRVFCSEKKDLNSVDHHFKQLENLRVIHCSEATNADIIPETFKSARDGIQVRGLWENNKQIFLEGIIFYVTNNRCGFTSYNMALQRRLVYMFFSTKFVDDPDPKKPEQKKKIENIEFKAKKNKKYGTAFLSILVNSFGKLKNYKDIDDMYKQTGLLDETIEFMNNQNQMLHFINKYIEYDEESKIEIVEFCAKYANWYKINMHLNSQLPAHTYDTEARNNLADYIFENKYFKGIKIKEI